MKNLIVSAFVSTLIISAVAPAMARPNNLELKFLKENASKNMESCRQKPTNKYLFKHGKCILGYMQVEKNTIGFVKTKTGYNKPVKLSSTINKIQFDVFHVIEFDNQFVWGYFAGEKNPTKVKLNDLIIMYGC